jgi:hypothetical protein
MAIWDTKPVLFGLWYLQATKRPYRQISGNHNRRSDNHSIGDTSSSDTVGDGEHTDATVQYPTTRTFSSRKSQGNGFRVHAGQAILETSTEQR